MQFNAFGIVNQETKTLYSFGSKEFADMARLSLKDFDKIYEQYTLRVEIDAQGNVFISDQTIEDLHEPVFLQKLDPDYFSAFENKEKLEKEMLNNFSITKLELGYKFNFEEIKTAELKTSADYSPS